MEEQMEDQKPRESVAVLTSPEDIQRIREYAEWLIEEVQGPDYTECPECDGDQAHITDYAFCSYCRYTGRVTWAARARYLSETP